MEEIKPNAFLGLAYFDILFSSIGSKLHNLIHHCKADNRWFNQRGLNKPLELFLNRLKITVFHIIQFLIIYLY